MRYLINRTDISINDCFVKEISEKYTFTSSKTCNKPILIFGIKSARFYFRKNRQRPHTICSYRIVNEY